MLALPLERLHTLNRGVIWIAHLVVHHPNTNDIPHRSYVGIIGTNPIGAQSAHERHARPVKRHPGLDNLDLLGTTRAIEIAPQQRGINGGRR